MKLAEYAKKINSMTTTEQLEKTTEHILQEIASINNDLNQKINNYMDKYGKSLDLVDKIMIITGEAYSGDSEMTIIEMANKITIAVDWFAKEVKGKQYVMDRTIQ